MDQTSQLECLDQDQTFDTTTQSCDTTFIKKLDPTVSDKLKRPESSALKEKILNFIRDVQQDKYPQEKLPRLVQQKIQEFEDEFQQTWNEQEDQAIENGEAIEKLITKPLCAKLISIEPSKDKQIEFALKLFDFIKLEHLEIDEQVEKHAKFQQAVKQIQKIDTVQTPREKLYCIINACKFVSVIVNQLSDNTPTGADNFLPVLIYVTLKGQPTRPYSNIQYISLYRAPKRITGPEEYYFTAYESTLEFVESLDHHKLKINPTEFQQLCSQRMEGMKQGELHQQHEQSQFNFHTHYVNLQMLKLKIFEVQKKSRYYELSKKHKLKYASKQLSEISLAEVGDFHQEYVGMHRNLIDMQKDLDNLHCLMESILKDCLHNNQKSVTKKFFGLL